MQVDQIVVHIGGMDCANCANSISNLLKKKGLSDAQVNFATGEAWFTPVKEVSYEEVKSGIEGLGYKVLDGENSNSSFFSTEKRLLLSATFTIPLLLHMFPYFTWLQFPLVQLALCVPVFMIGVIQFGKSTFNSIKVLYPNMDVLIFTGFSAAFIYSLIGTFFSEARAHQYLFYETTASIITLVLIGNYIEKKAVKRAASSIEEYSKIKPLKARVILKIGEKEKTLETDIGNIKLGDILEIVAGERVPADGVLINGKGYIDQSMFTGEHEPIFVEAETKVIGGSILTDGVIKMRVEKTGQDAYLTKLIDLVKKASFNKPSIQKLGDKVSAIFVPLVIMISLVTFFVARFGFAMDNFHSMMNAIAVLVISCPCAMGLATPTAVMVGVGRSARNGIIIRGGDTLQALAEAKTFMFDKTGTLTTGKMSIARIEIHTSEYKEAEIKSIILSIELKSVHPIAKSVSEELKDFPQFTVENFEEIKGKGLYGTIEGKKIVLGSERILENKSLANGARFYLLIDGVITASVFLEEEIKPGTKSVIQQLNHDRVKTAIISGDADKSCQKLAESLEITTIYSNQLPHEKLEIIEKEKMKGISVMVGDGINDAPSLTAAHVGISFSGSSDIALQSSNVVILTNDISKLTLARKLAKNTLITIKQNLFWAFCYNLIAIPLAASGYLNPMWGAAFMAFSDIMVIGNSIRLNYKRL
ncbi:MAG: heavy metal translocating P-type ATPase [Bacteroidota bacterium]|jgi:Cu+-exporting ATPase